MAQLVTRVDDALAASVDDLVASGYVESRSDAVRIALEALIDRRRRDLVGQDIVRGYEERPQTDEEYAAADAAAVRMIADEPW